MSAREPLSRRALLATGGAAFLAACTGRISTRRDDATMSTPASGLAALEPELPAMMAVAGVPGVSLAIVDGANVTTRGYGTTRATAGNAVSADTVFEAASLSKPVFAYLVMQLVAEGAIDPDKPLGDYMPLPTTDPRSSKITTRHALSHSGGWRNWRNVPTHTLTAEFEPGSRFSYSGEGYYFVSRVVEKVTGKGILRLTRERIFEPLGMRRTAYMWSPELDANRAEPHNNRGVASESFGARSGKAFRETAVAAGKAMDDWTHEDTERASPAVNKDSPAFPNFLLPNVAGSMLTTATDYGNFLRHLLATPTGKSVLARMIAPQVTLNDALRWGLGFGLQAQGSGTQFWHWGDNFGFKNFVVGDAQARTAILVFTNGQNGRSIYERVIRAVRGDQRAFLWI